MAVVKILVAVPDPLNGLVVATQVGALSHRPVGPVHTEAEAARAVRTVAPDAAIVDAALGPEVGSGIAERLFAHRAVPIVLLREYEAEPGAHPRVRTAPYRELVKPVSIEDLAAGVRQARALFERWRHFERDVTALERSMGAGAVLGRARTALMEWGGMSPDAADAWFERQIDAAPAALASDADAATAALARRVLVARALDENAAPR